MMRIKHDIMAQYNVLLIILREGNLPLNVFCRVSICQYYDPWRRRHLQDETPFAESIGSHSTLSGSFFTHTAVSDHLQKWGMLQCDSGQRRRHMHCCTY